MDLETVIRAVKFFVFFDFDNDKEGHNENSLLCSDEQMLECEWKVHLAMKYTEKSGKLVCYVTAC